MSTITREYSQLIVTLRWVKKVQLYIKLLCWLVSLRDRGFNHSTQSCSSCVLRGMILVNLVCSKTRQTLTDYLTFAGNSSHIKCVVQPSWFSTATTLTIWNVNPRSGPGCHMLNSLHCFLLFWEAQESRQSTRPSRQTRPLINAINTNLMVTISFPTMMVGKVVC